MISFRGNLVNQTSVIKDYNFIAVTSNYPTTLAELNPYDKNDRDALEHLGFIYGSRGADASLISDIFQYEGESTSNLNSRYFVLTEQEDEFERIKPSAILGVAKTAAMEGDNVFIDMLQVNPFYVFNNPYSHLKRCGTSMIESLKKIFSDKNLFIHSPKNLIDFFKRHGFEIVDSPAKNMDVLMKCTRKI